MHIDIPSSPGDSAPWRLGLRCLAFTAPLRSWKAMAIIGIVQPLVLLASLAKASPGISAISPPAPSLASSGLANVAALPPRSHMADMVAEIFAIPDRSGGEPRVMFVAVCRNGGPYLAHDARCEVLHREGRYVRIFGCVPAHDDAIAIPGVLGSGQSIRCLGDWVGPNDPALLAELRVEASSGSIDPIPANNRAVLGAIAPALTGSEGDVADGSPGEDR